MSRQEAERIAAQVLMGWQDDAFSMSYEITDEQARKVVAALADAGLLADPAERPKMMQSRFPKRVGEDTVELAAGTPEEQPCDERRTR